MKTHLTLAMIPALGLLTAPALGQSDVADAVGDMPAERPPLIPRRWYRPALAVAYSAAPIIAYYGSEAADSYWPVAPAWLLAPGVHWAGRRGWRAGISLVMQPVAAYSGWMAGIALTRPTCMEDAEFECGHEDAQIAILIGYLAWGLADVVLVSDVKPRPLSEDEPLEAKVQVRPLAGVTPSGELVGGVMGRF